MDDTPMRVLVAIDGSEASNLAVDFVANMAWPAGSKIVIAEAVETGAGLFGGPLPALAMVQADRIEVEARDQAHRTVDEARGRLNLPGADVEAVVLQGRPAGAIVDRARSMQADLIVIGSRGHGTIESMVLGSVSAEVVDHAPAPVLVVRGRGMDRIVLAWDGSPSASRAADLLTAWPFFDDSVVRVVSVADIEVPWWTGFPEAGSPEFMPMYVEAANASRQEHQELARSMTDRLHGEGLAAEAEPRKGDAATEILAAARASRADVIVMGTRGRTGLMRLLIGGVARNVLQHAPCSVLIVPDGSAAISGRRDGDR